MSLKALDVGGHVSLIDSSLSQSGAGLDPLLLSGRRITLGSISVGSRADFEAMNRAMAMHRLHPVIDRTFPFARTRSGDAFLHATALAGIGTPSAQETRSHYGLRLESEARSIVPRCRRARAWHRDRSLDG